MSEEKLSNWINIARTGTFKDSSGTEHTFTEQDLENIRAAFDPKKSEAALVFGHPKDSDPAFGWVRELRNQGGILSARFAGVPDKVKQLVEEGRYRYVSMSLAPDKKRLLHVGLLGAAAPAIDGLGQVSFKEADDGITINFSTNGDGNSMSAEEMQKRIGALESQVKEKDDEIAKLKTKLSETETGKKSAEEKAEKTAADFAAFKNGIVTSTREARIDALVKDGKLEPAKRDEALSFAAALGGIEAPVNFSAPDGKTEKISAEEKYFRDLEARPTDPRFANFSLHAPAPGHAMQPGPDWSPSDMTSKM